MARVFWGLWMAPPEKESAPGGRLRRFESLMLRRHQCLRRAYVRTLSASSAHRRQLGEMASELLSSTIPGVARRHRSRSTRCLLSASGFGEKLDDPFTQGIGETPISLQRQFDAGGGRHEIADPMEVARHDGKPARHLLAFGSLREVQDVCCIVSRAVRRGWSSRWNVGRLVVERLRENGS